MYKSIFSDLQPLVFGGESGVLDIRRQAGSHARIYLREGMIEGVTSGVLKGTKAAKTCAGWVNITSTFQEGAKPAPGGSGGVDTNTFLEILEKVDKRLSQVLEVVSSSDAIFRVDPDKLSSQGNYSAQDMKIALLLNGKRSVGEIIEKAGAAEIAVLISIYKLVRNGAASMVTDQKPMDPEKSEAFLSSLTEKLSDLVGPVADMLVDEALDDIGCGRETLSENQVPKVIDLICTHMDDKECAVIHSWADDTLKE